MTGSRFALALATTLLATSGLVATQCAAQDYPARSVKIIVPFGPGGPADVTARQIGGILQENFGQPFVVENRTGAGGVIGTVEVVKSPPDGYTLLMMSNTQTANESLVPTRNYELMRDLTPIAPVNYSDLVMVVHPSVQTSTADSSPRSRSRETELRVSGRYAVPWPASCSNHGGARCACALSQQRRGTHGRHGGRRDDRRGSGDDAEPRHNQVRARHHGQMVGVLPNVPTASAGVAGYGRQSGSD